jgi:hypothetical protein
LFCFKEEKKWISCQNKRLPKHINVHVRSRTREELPFLPKDFNQSYFVREIKNHTHHEQNLSLGAGLPTNTTINTTAYPQSLTNESYYTSQMDHYHSRGSSISGTTTRNSSVTTMTAPFFPDIDEDGILIDDDFVTNKFRKFPKTI